VAGAFGFVEEPMRTARADPEHTSSNDYQAIAMTSYRYLTRATGFDIDFGLMLLRLMVEAGFADVGNEIKRFLSTLGDPFNTWLNTSIESARGVLEQAFDDKGQRFEEVVNAPGMWATAWLLVSASGTRSQSQRPHPKGSRWPPTIRHAGTQVSRRSVEPQRLTHPSLGCVRDRFSSSDGGRSGQLAWYKECADALGRPRMRQAARSREPRVSSALGACVIGTYGMSSEADVAGRLRQSVRGGYRRVRVPVGTTNMKLPVGSRTLNLGTTDD
jgi:hypothetical protein